MGKKKRKKAKKQKPGLLTSQAIDKFLDETIAQYAEPHMIIEFAYEGKIYKGTVPCVGEIDR